MHLKIKIQSFHHKIDYKILVILLKFYELSKQLFNMQFFHSIMDLIILNYFHIPNNLIKKIYEDFYLLLYLNVELP